MSVLSISNRILHRFSSQYPLSPSFTLLSSTRSNDLKAHLHLYSHNKTNARIYHFQNSDPENAFASIVKTYVHNDTGCPHILEHLATCGSKKYPIRDPFFNMLKRSVYTYMNAWTGDDFTSYPFSSANPADWQNLHKVYLDMSMNALLNELDFRQEGWRYEINEANNRELKGIVLNEMKGAYQDSDRQLIKEINT
jgi:Zn-dependent M16 (insulinase) family peptidase